MKQDKKVNDLLSQMRTAVDTARAVTAAAPPPVFTAQPVMPAFNKVDEPSQSRALLQLINELMAGVETRFGIKPGTLVERKLVRIFKDMPMSTLKDWVESMNSCSPEHSEWQSLVENLTVHETYFCRDPDLMSMLADEILPHLLNLRKNQKQLQVWSAASSTGEEVYDLTFSALRAMQKAGYARMFEGKLVPESNWGLFVFGSDISNQALRTARAAMYGDLGMGSFRNLPDDWKTMFEPVKMAPANAMPGVNYFKIREWVRQCTRFERFNLMNTRPPVTGMDLIFCRNVLIYFEDSIKRTVQQMLARALAPGGVLVLGASVQMLAPEYFESRLGKGGPWYVRNDTRV
ncbi:MAG: CheR family methyltransferase [Pseudomonadota bacterium]